ncbi:MAG: phage tail tape measure protein [Myxococcales bacterium]|nr:phage tail tape measure protein [Myxococcales bacterium]
MFAKTGDDAAKMARRTGLAVESVTALGFAARQSGADASQLESGFKRMARSTDDLRRGLSTAVDAYGALGISIKDLDGLSPEESFLLIADRLSQVADASQKSALAQQIFGRAGAQLIPLLDQGAAGIRGLMQEARDLGIVMSSEDAAAAENLTDAIGRVKSTFVALAQTIGASIAPALTAAANTIARIVGIIRRWIDQNRAIVATIAAVGAGVAAAGAAIVGVGLAANVAAFAIAGLGTVIGIVGAVLAAVLSPIGLVTAAVIALGVGTAVYTGVAGKAVEALKHAFAALKVEVGDTVSAIASALVGGDLETAGELIGELLAVGFEAGKAKVLDILTDLGSESAKKVVELGTQLRTRWTDITYAIRDILGDLSADIQKLWEDITSNIAKALNTTRAKFDESFDAKAANDIIDDATTATKDQIDADNQFAKDKRVIQKLYDNADATEAKQNANAIIDGVFGPLKTASEALITDARARLDTLNAKARDNQQRIELERIAGTGYQNAPNSSLNALAGNAATLDQIASQGRAAAFASFRASELGQLAVKAVNERMADSLASIDDKMTKLIKKPTGAVFG